MICPWAKQTMCGNFNLQSDNKCGQYFVLQNVTVNSKFYRDMISDNIEAFVCSINYLNPTMISNKDFIHFSEFYAFLYPTPIEIGDKR